MDLNPASVEEAITAVPAVAEDVSTSEETLHHTTNAQGGRISTPTIIVAGLITRRTPTQLRSWSRS
jgi:hypothetical protein